MKELRVLLDGTQTDGCLSELDNSCFTCFGMVPHQVNLLPDNWREWPGAGQLLHAVSEKIRSSLEHSGIIAVPRASWIFLPLYAQAVRENVGIEPTFEIRIAVPQRPGGRWLAETLSVLRATQGFARTLALTFENEPQIVTKEWPPVAANLLELCTRISQAQTGFLKGEFADEIDEAYRTVKVLFQMSTAVQLPEGEIILGWRSGRGWQEERHPFCPTEAWNSIRFESNAPPSSSVLLDLYQSPAYVWIRKAVWISAGKERPAKLHSRYERDLKMLNGLYRFCAYAPWRLAIETPPLMPAQLELEVLVEAGDAALEAMITSLGRGRGR